MRAAVLPWTFWWPGPEKFLRRPAFRRSGSFTAAGIKGWNLPAGSAYLPFACKTSSPLVVRANRMPSSRNRIFLWWGIDMQALNRCKAQARLSICHPRRACPNVLRLEPPQLFKKEQHQPRYAEQSCGNNERRKVKILVRQRYVHPKKAGQKGQRHENR